MIKMKRNIKYLAGITFLLIGMSIYAQPPSALEAFTKIENYYKTVKKFNFQIEYKMFRGYSGNEVTESYKGSIYRYGDISQIKILGSEILQFPEAQLTINSENKTIRYNKISKDVIQKSPVDVSTFLKFYKETSAKISGNILIYEMVLKNAQIPIPYNKIIIHVNKDTFEIEKQIFYFATKVPFVDESGDETLDSARMEISFKQNSFTTQKVPKLNDYVFVEGNNVRLAKAYQTYTIIDQTNLQTDEQP